MSFGGVMLKPGSCFEKESAAGAGRQSVSLSVCLSVHPHTIRYHSLLTGAITLNWFAGKLALTSPPSWLP